MRFLLFILAVISPLGSLVHADDVATTTTTAIADTVVTVPEIPYYLRQLNETTVEMRRIELTKIIHNAVVGAKLSDKHVVNMLEPMIEKIRGAIASGLDRAYLEGSSMWLGSAVDYFEREKLRPTISIPETDWMESQTATSDGGRLNTTPDKIWLVNKEKSVLVAESSNIHEAVITRDGKRAAFIRESNDASRAEIWTVNMKNRVRKKITTVPSCLTLLISADGDHIFYQEKPAQADKDSVVWSIGFGGGNPKKIGEVRLLQTIVEKGRYKNALVIYKTRLHPLGVAVQECGYAWDDGGREIGRLENITCR